MSIYFGNQKVSPLIVVPDNKMAKMASGELTEITEEDLSSIDRLRPYAFAGNSALEKITIPANITRYIGERCFVNSAIKNIIVKSNCNIPDYFCPQCSNLANIIFSDEITLIGQGAFESCPKLTTIKLPDNLQYIRTYAFRATKLNNFVIPSKVLSIGSQSFRSIGQNRTITLLPTTPPTIQSDTFDEITFEKIIVPKGTAETYKAATNWSSFADYIVEADE